MKQDLKKLSYQAEREFFEKYNFKEEPKKNFVEKVVIKI